MKTRTIGFLAIALFISFFLDNIVFEFFLMIRNPFLDAVMGWFSHEITVFVILVMISSLFLYEEHKSRFIPVLFLSFFTALLTSYILKFLFIRPRPENVSNMILTIAGLNFSFPNYSFPSTHSAMAFGVLPVLDKEFKKLKIFWLFFSVMIAISRIYLNQHYLSDVIGGIIIGYLTGHYILKLGEKHGIAKRFSEHIRN